MGQGDVLEVLEKNKKPMAAIDIARVLKCDRITINHCLARLIHSRSVKIIEIDRHQALKLYKSKRRMRLYYI